MLDEGVEGENKGENMGERGTFPLKAFIRRAAFCCVQASGIISWGKDTVFPNT